MSIIDSLQSSRLIRGDDTHAIQASQPHLNDMNRILSAVNRTGRRILMLPEALR